jgi:hypothetical protein
MSYAMSASLQAAVYQHLVADAALTALVGQEIYDLPLPVDAPDAPELHITLGEERVRDAGTATSRGAQHDFSVTVHSSAQGFASAKAAAGAVSEALVDAPLILARGRLVALRMLFASAERGTAPERRRIVLRFRAVIDDTI